MLFDLHIVAMFDAVWPTYRDSLAAFQLCMEPYVGADKAAEWHASLLESPPKFRTMLAPGSEKLPLVSVELIAGDKDTAFLGNSMGNGTLGYFFTERVEVTVLSKRDEITRALCLWVMAVMLRANESFQQSGYIDTSFLGAGELSLEELLAAEDLGAFARRLSYQSRREICTPQSLTGVVEDKPVVIQLSNVVEDIARDPADGAGVPGGVTPVTE